jgi:hypothetical protein
MKGKRLFGKAGYRDSERSGYRHEGHGCLQEVRHWWDATFYNWKAKYYGMEVDTP